MTFCARTGLILLGALVSVAEASDSWYDGVIDDHTVHPSHALRGETTSTLHAHGVKKGTPFIWLRQDPAGWTDTLSPPFTAQYVNVPDGDGSDCVNCPCAGWGSFREAKEYETNPRSPLHNQIIVGKALDDDHLPNVTFPRSGKWFLCLAHVKEPKSCNLGGSVTVCPTPGVPKSLNYQWTEEDKHNPTFDVWYSSSITGKLEVSRLPKVGSPTGPIRAPGVKKGTPYLWLKYDDANPWIDTLAAPFTTEYFNVPDGDGTTCHHCACAGWGSYEETREYETNPSSPLRNKIEVGKVLLDGELPSRTFALPGIWFLCLAKTTNPTPYGPDHIEGLPASAYYQYTAVDAMAQNPTINIVEVEHA